MGTGYQVAVGGNGAAYRLSVVPGTRPSVSITAPLNGATIRRTNSVTIRADADDDDGTIARLDFFLDFRLVATLTNSPYVFTLPLQNAVSVSHFLQAKATDDSGLESLSGRIVFQAYPPPPANDAGSDIALSVYRGTTLSDLALVEPIQSAPTDSRFELTFEAEAGATYQIAAQAGFVPAQKVAFALVLDARRFTRVERLISGGFRLGFAGRPGVAWILQASTNLIDWTSLATNSAPGGNFDWVDANSAGQPDRFYRARAGP
jgi:hypothetical protein